MAIIGGLILLTPFVLWFFAPWGMKGAIAIVLSVAVGGPVIKLLAERIDAQIIADETSRHLRSQVRDLREGVEARSDDSKSLRDACKGARIAPGRVVRISLVKPGVDDELELLTTDFSTEVHAALPKGPFLTGASSLSDVPADLTNVLETDLFLIVKLREETTTKTGVEWRGVVTVADPHTGVHCTGRVIFPLRQGTPSDSVLLSWIAREGYWH